MPKFKNITVSVPIEVYREARRFAALYDSSVSAMTAYLLEHLPDAIKRSRFPKGGVKPSTPPAPAGPAPSPAPHAPGSTSPGPAAPSPAPPAENSINFSKCVICGCETVKPHPTQDV